MARIQSSPDLHPTPGSHLQEIEISEPEALDRERLDWFKIDAVDVDNIAYHLATSADNQAWLGEQIAHAEYHYRVFEDASNMREAHVYIQYKCKPFKKKSARAGAYVEADCSDDLAKMCSRVDHLAVRYRKAAMRWRQRRDTLKGYQEAFVTKRLFLASLCGINRAGIEAETQARRTF